MRKRALAVLSIVAIASTLLSIETSPARADAPSRRVAANTVPWLRPINDRVAGVGHAVRITPRAGDADGRPRRLTFSTRGRPAWLKLNSRSGVLSGIAPKGANGKRFPITLRVTDGAASRSRQFTVRVVPNKAPVLQPLSHRAVGVGRSFTIRPKASDPDRGPGPLRYTSEVQNRPRWLKFNRTTGVVSGTVPKSAAGQTYLVRLTVTDGAARQSRSFRLHVNNSRPFLQAIPARSAQVGDEFERQLVGTDADDAPQRLRYSMVRGPLFLSVDSTSGLVRGTIPAHAAGKTFRPVFRVDDGRLLSKPRTLVLDVGAIDNEAPVLDAAAFDVDENSAAGPIGTVTATDPDGDALTYSIATGQSGEFTIDGVTGALSTTLALDHETAPEHAVPVVVSDGIEATTGEVTVTVGDVDESPALSHVDDRVFTEDVPIEQIAFDAVDPEGAAVTFEVAAGLPTGLTFDGDRTIAGTPTVPGEYSVSVTATDEGGHSADQAFTITVENVNDAPVMADQHFSVGEGTPAGTVVGNIAATDEDSDPLAFSATGGDTDALAVSADGAITVADASAMVAGEAYVLQVEVTDGTAPLVGASISIDVIDVDTPPTLDDVAFGLGENAAPGTAVGAATGTDPDGDTISYAITNGNVGDAFAIDAASGAITVAGAIDFETTSVYTLTIVGTAGALSDEAVVTVNVTDVNESPVLGELIDVPATEDEPIANIVLAANDPDGDVITFTVNGLPAGLTLDGDTISGTPMAPGEYEVAVEASDGELVDSATFTITVANVNDQPVVAPIDDATVDENAPMPIIVVTATDDDGGDTIAITAAGLPEGVELTDNEDRTGTIAGTPTTPGTYPVTVTVDDGNAGTATAEFTITVDDVNAAPVIESIDPATITVTEGEEADVDITVAASDPDDDDLTYSIANLPADLSAVDNGDGTITIGGTATTAGLYSALVVADDGTAESAGVELAVTVEAVEPVPTCAPLSTLVCGDVPVSLPYEVTFDGADGGLDDTGFTMVDPPSQRTTVDQSPAPATPSDPDVPGYEPELLDVTGGDLVVSATKGIQYRAPGQPSPATLPNAQLNALGVGLSGTEPVYEIETTLPAATFPGATNSSQQGGLWFGLDEDNYVKLVAARTAATTNKVQLVSEIGGVATPSNEHELNTAAFAAGEDVRLVLHVEDTPGDGGVATASYAVGDGELVDVVDTANVDDSELLSIPQSFFDGELLPDAETGPATYAGVFATKRNAASSDVVDVAFADFAVRAVEAPNAAPVIDPIADVEAIEEVAIVDVAVTAPDADGDPVAITSDLDVDGLTLTDNGDSTATLAGTPDAGTAAESPYTVTVTADDGTDQTTESFTITVDEPGAPCSPISTEPCATVPVSLPYTLAFDGTEGGLADTGFTMVDAPSERDSVDQAPAPETPTHADVPGYEPDLLEIADGNLVVTATKGIQYRKAPESANTNSLLNALGVGVTGTETGYELETTVVAPTFPGAGNTAQQGGLWFGLDEDNYVKVVVSRVSASTVKVQLVREIGAIATPATQYELNSAPFANGQDVQLVLQVEDTAGTGADGGVARAFYSIDGGPLQELSDSANTISSTELPVPQSFFDGEALPDGDDVSFAGLFATKRTALPTESLDVTFGDFAVRDLGGDPEPFEPIDVTVNFQSETAPVPDGALRDFGQPFDARADADQGDGAWEYGWVRENSEEPLSLVGNGRDRNRTSGPAASDQRLDTIMHMQFGDVTNPNCTTNVCEPGAWEFAVPNGSYRITAAVGDQPGSNDVYDSEHVINVENQVLIEGFQASAAAEYSTMTTEVGVFDDELTLSAVGGTNTKIAYVRIESLSTTAADTRPFVADVRPGHRSTGAFLDAGMATDLHLVGTVANPGPVDAATVNANTVKLFAVAPDGTSTPVAGNPGTSGGGDVINFQQTGNLQPNTTYRYVIDGVADTLGNEFIGFTSIFATGTEISDGDGGDFEPVEGASFEKVDLGKNGKYFSSLVVHEGYLWATTVGQGMFRYPINDDGTLGDEQTINAFQGRAAIGFVFDDEDPNVAWVTNATANINNESQPFGSKLSRVDFSANVTSPEVDDVFVNLPRSQKDHLSNSLSWGPGGDLYFLQGSNQAAGDPDGAWGNRGETLLTAALLHFDPDEAWAAVQADGPIDVKTVDRGGPYNPFAANAPLQIYASGIRNAYDLVQHSNGHIYVPTNGTASGANSPGVNVNGGTLTRAGQVNGVDVTAVCANRRIDGAPYTAPAVPAITNHNTQRDFLFDVEANGFYGHPNPERCEWVLNNGGNAEGAGSGGSKYAANVQPDRNYDGWAYDFEFNKSPNGVIEYESNTFGGALAGRIMVVRYSNFDDVLTLQPAGNGQILGGQPGSTIAGFSGFDDPLDITEDLEVNPGNLYVNSYDQGGGSPKLYLLRVPTDQQASNVSADVDRIVGNHTVGGGAAGLGTVTMTNDGNEPAELGAATLTGTGAGAYGVTSTPALPRSLAPGESVELDVSFNPSAEGVAVAQLALAVDGASGPSVELRGLGTDGLGGANEPSLQYILDAWDLDIDTGDDDATTNEIHSSATQRVSPTLGDAIDVETFERASDGPVSVEVLSVFGPTDSTPITEVSWYAAGQANTASPVFNVDNTPLSNGQSLVPQVNGALQFDPGEAEFGMVSRWPFFANRMLFSEDSLNTFSGAIGHHVRVYPLIENGSAVPNAYVVATEEHTSGFDYQDVVYVIRNVNPAGELEPPPTGETIKVNFQTEIAAVPSGYLKDFGQAYGARVGGDQGSGLTYGWINATSSAPEGRTTTGRDRELNDDQRLDTLMHMQYQQISNPNCTINNCNTGTWEMAVANGTWQVTAAVGDPNMNSDPEAHLVRAEGTPLFSTPFVPSGPAGASTRHAAGTAIVEVADGKLTIDAVGGTNTKLNYVELTPIIGGGELIAQVNFQPSGSPTPAGWTADSGELFTAGRGYGWVRTEGGATKVADTRDRAEDSDPLNGTMMIVDDATVAAISDGEWEHALADGTYTVTVSVGDAGYADSVHGVTVEGTEIVDGYAPSGPGDYHVASGTVEVTDGRLTLASSGTNTKVQWITIATGSGVDVLPPQIDLSIAGVNGPGGYINSATVTADITDSGGSNVEFVDWELDGASIAAPAGSTLVVDTLGGHTVEVTATDGAGNTTTESTSFTIVDGETAAIEIDNLDATRLDGEPIPGMHDDFLVMHLLNGNVTTHVTHEVATLRITNTDPDEDLVITGLDLSAPGGPVAGGVRTSTTHFTTPGTTLPVTIEPGDSYDLDVLFDGPGSKGLYGATMTIASNAENAPNLPVQLRGAWQPMPEGGQEVTLTQVARAFGYTMEIGEPLDDDNDSPLGGDEVRSKLWKRLDSSEPMAVRQLAALHGCCGAQDAFNIPGDGGTRGSFAHKNSWGQSLLPRISTGDGTAGSAFAQRTNYTPTGNFELTAAGYSSNTDGNLGVRIWPLEFDGEAVPGAYLMVQDFVQNGCGAGSANCDYNDNMYLITNIAPVDPQ